MRERGLVYASHNLSPYFVEGTKTFAYEVFMQLAPSLPDHIVIPVGNGSLYLGAWKGFTELLAAGRVDSIPRLHCVQARAVMPIAAAYRGDEWLPDGQRYSCRWDCLGESAAQGGDTPGARGQRRHSRRRGG